MGMSGGGDLYYLEIHQLAGLIRSKQVSPVEVTHALLERIAALDGYLNSYSHVMSEQALEQAREAERAICAGNYLGLLHGVPVTVKDLFWTAGAPTAGGSTLRRNFVAGEDATVVRRLRESGAVILGKLQLTEGAFATHHPSITPPVNPWGADHWVGASSSGPGAATAAGLCFASLATDSGGSIRLPCAANGLTGIKPTWGRVSRHGVFELAASLDHVGPIARSARDATILLAAIAGRDERDPTSLPGGGPDLSALPASLHGVRIGFDTAWISHSADSTTQRAFHQALDVLQDAGGKLEEIEFPNAWTVADEWETHCGVQAAVAHAADYPARASEYGPALSRLIDQGREVSGMRYQEVRLNALAFTGSLDALMETVDLVALPVQPFAAPTHDQLAALARDPALNSRLIQFTSPFNVSGHPAIALPCGMTANSMPVGFQLVARKGDEATLCRAGIAFQQASDWHRLHPQAIVGTV